jgi:hypothetical protein
VERFPRKKLERSGGAEISENFDFLVFFMKL